MDCYENIDYLISVHQSVWWISKQTLNNAGILSQEFEVYTLDSAFGILFVD
jgi:hypothetical protein